MVEGEIFADHRLKQGVANELIRRGFICWDAKSMSTNEYAARGIAVNAPASDDGCRFLLAEDLASILKQAARDNDIRVRPADNVIMLQPKGRNSLLPTMVAWPAGTATRFGAFVRLVGRSTPVEFLFEAIETIRLLAPTKPFGPIETLATKSVILEPDETYQRVQVEISAIGEEKILRVTCRLANSEAGEMRVLGVLAEPFLAK